MTFVPEPAYGWPTGVETVRLVRRTARGEYTAVDKVEVNGVHVGFVVGRPERFGKRRWWDHLTGTTWKGTATVRLTYPTDDRRMAVCALAEATKEKWSK